MFKNVPVILALQERVWCKTTNTLVGKAQLSKQLDEPGTK